MSDLNRLKELAALLRSKPESVVESHKTRSGALVEENKDLQEMSAANKFSSGAMKASAAKMMVKSFMAGEDTFDMPNGDKFTAVKSLTVKTLEAGQIVMGSYDASNQGAHLYAVLGFNDGNDNDAVQHKSVKELLAKAGVKSLRDIDGAHMVVKDLSSGEEGGWFYQYKGRFVRGSGAEPLTFTLVEKV